MAIFKGLLFRGRRRKAYIRVFKLTLQVENKWLLLGPFCFSISLFIQSHKWGHQKGQGAANGILRFSFLMLCSNQAQAGSDKLIGWKWIREFCQFPQERCPSLQNFHLSSVVSESKGKGNKITCQLLRFSPHQSQVTSARQCWGSCLHIHVIHHAIGYGS